MSSVVSAKRVVQTVSMSAIVETDPRESFLDAAAACFERLGLARTTMGDVAKAAGVHRTTLYRYFADRDALVLGVFLREAVPLVERAAARMRAAEDIPTAIAEAMSRAVEELRASPHFSTIFSEDSRAASAQLTLMSSELDALSYAALAEPLSRASEQGLLRAGIDIADAARWLTRIALSFVVEVPPSSVREQRRLLKTYVLPGIFREV